MRSKEVMNGAYVVYEDGTIWSNKSKKFLEGGLIGRGGKYRAVLLRENGTPKMRYIHRLVAECFISNPDNKPEVNHKDGNKKNNYVDNLEWATRAENTQHAYALGLMDNVLATKACKCGQLIRPSTDMCRECRDVIKQQEKRQDMIDKRNKEADELMYVCHKNKDREFLKYWRTGMNYREIGEVMGCTKQRVQQRYERIKERYAENEAYITMHPEFREFFIKRFAV